MFDIDAKLCYSYLDGLLNSYCISLDKERQFYFERLLNDESKFKDLPDYIKKSCRQKLIKDGFIIESNNYYSASLEGILFNENGAYAGKKNRDSISVTLQSLQTWVIALGTIGLFLLEGVKYMVSLCTCHG